MTRLADQDREAAERFMALAAEAATHALCQRAKCGTVIVKDGQVIGRGYNAPPLDDERNRTCGQEWALADKPKRDRTCCVHAEWRAIMDALRTHPGQVAGSTLYFTRVDDAGRTLFAGEPYCTVCSRLALDAGITTFALWHEDGIDVYPTDEYDRLSYAYGQA